jgi:GTP-binding protein HflX
VPQILVFNKIDALAAVNSPLRQQDWFELDGLQVPRIFVSARPGDGIAVLRSALANTVSRDSLAPADRPDIPFLHEEGP